MYFDGTVAETKTTDMDLMDEKKTVCSHFSGNASVSNLACDSTLFTLVECIYFIFSWAFLAILTNEPTRAHY